MIPEGWHRDFKSYQRKGTEECKASLLASEKPRGKSKFQQVAGGGA